MARVPHEQPVCPSCGYSLEGIPPGVCPECGVPFTAATLAAAPRIPSLRRRIAAISVIVVIGAAIGLGNAEALNAPCWYAPLNAVNIIPVFAFAWSLTAMPIASASIALVVALPLLHRSLKVAWLALVVTGLVAILDVWWFVEQFAFAVEYHGWRYALSVAILNFVFAIGLAAAFARNRRRPRFRSVCAFHLLLAVWVTGWAFPYLGELP